MMQTADVATGFAGTKPYQQRAKQILPILVRQAESGQPITYTDLAREVGMPNPRNLNYPLGCIGNALRALSPHRGGAIPHIASLVINQGDGMPGRGFDEFLKEQGVTWNTQPERKAKIEVYWASVSAYPYWREILELVGVEPVRTDLAELLDRAGKGPGGGEGPEHLALKMFIKRNPGFAGLKIADPEGEVEVDIPSGDCIDVLFSQRTRLHAVEVKPAGVSPKDVVRGLFQCVKYRAVLEARAAHEGDRRDITACLVLGGPFPADLWGLRNSLGVQVFENIVPQLKRPMEAR